MLFGLMEMRFTRSYVPAPVCGVCALWVLPSHRGSNMMRLTTFHLFGPPLWY